MQAYNKPKTLPASHDPGSENPNYERVLAEDLTPTIFISVACHLMTHKVYK